MATETRQMFWKEIFEREIGYDYKYFITLINQFRLKAKQNK